jgi:enoyl-CoA hydratase/carnithine racemase
MIDLTRDGPVFTLTLNDGENRWNTTFVRAVAKALDEVGTATGPAALITTLANEKFFSNGLDLEWIRTTGEHRGGDRTVFGAEFMALMARLITLPIPTVCAINGHAFGAGFMAALCHDVRIMREDRGFACANEMQLGLAIPLPELALFRHKIPLPAFYETVQLARRWTGPDAKAAGIVQQVASAADLLGVALQRANELAPLAANREVFGRQKQLLFGENAVLNGPHGAAYMLEHSADY